MRKGKELVGEKRGAGLSRLTSGGKKDSRRPGGTRRVKTKARRPRVPGHKGGCKKEGGRPVRLRLGGGGGGGEHFWGGEGSEKESNVGLKKKGMSSHFLLDCREIPGGLWV